MKGFYLVNTEMYNRRPHSFQILSTIQAINGFLEIDPVLPKYSNAKELEEFLKEYGTRGSINFRFLPSGFKHGKLIAFILFNIPVIFWFINKVLKEEIDFVYFRSSLFAPTIIVARLFKVPYFFETHRKPISKNEKFRMHYVARHATGIITITKGLKEYYKKFNNNITVAHDGVNLERFNISMTKNESRKILKLGKNKIIGFYTGTISSTKGTDLILEIAKELKDVLFLLIGDFKEKKLDSPVNVRILRRISQEKIPILLKSADFLILPNPDNDMSQSPMKLFEYMASGRPIISSSLSNIREVLPNKGNLFFKPEDEDDFSSKIKEYLSNKDNFDKDSKNNIEEVKKYTWSKRGSKIAEFIKESIKP